MIDQAFSLKLITCPTVWVASADDVKKWGRIPAGDIDDDDVILETIKSCTEVMEVLANRVFCTQTLEIRLDDFGDGVIQLPTGPWQSITSVKYYEPVAGVLTTITSTDYLLDEVSGILTPAYNVDWPTPQARGHAVRIQFKAGYGDAATAPPMICKRAVILGVLDELENRHGRFEIPAGVRQKLQMLWPGTI